MVPVKVRVESTEIFEAPMRAQAMNGPFPVRQNRPKSCWPTPRSPVPPLSFTVPWSQA